MLAGSGHTFASVSLDNDSGHCKAQPGNDLLAETLRAAGSHCSTAAPVFLITHQTNCMKIAACWVLYAYLSVAPGEGHACAPCLQDCFSFGMVLWELLTLDMPFWELSNPWQVKLQLWGMQGAHGRSWAGSGGQAHGTRHAGAWCALAWLPSRARHHAMQEGLTFLL